MHNKKREKRLRNIKSKLLRNFFDIEPEFKTEYNWALNQFQTAKRFTTLITKVKEFKIILKFDTTTPIVEIFESQKIRSFFFQYIKKTKRYYKRSDQHLITKIITGNLSETKNLSIDFIQNIFEWAINNERDDGL